MSRLPLQLPHVPPAVMVRLLLIAEEMHLRYDGSVWLVGSGLHDSNPSDWDIRVVVSEDAWAKHDIKWWGTEAALRTQSQRIITGIVCDIRIYPDSFFYRGDVVRLDSLPPRCDEPVKEYMGHTEDQTAEAIRTIEANRDKPEFHVLLGSLLFMRGDVEMAMQAFLRALQLDDKHYPAWLNLGNVFYERRNYKQAAVCCYRAIQLKPDYAKAFCNLANALCQLNAEASALAFYQRAIKLEPDEAVYHHNMSNCLLTMHRYDAARRELNRAIELSPGEEKILNTLGNLRTATEDHYGAAAAYSLAIKMNPKYAPLYTNLANVFMTLGMLKPARLNYERGLVLDSRNAGVRYNLALAYLREGNYTQGWRAYESRFQFQELKSKQRNFSQPFWRGEDIAGKRILIHAEQGMGDTFQFCRYVPLVASRGAVVLFEVQHGLQRLMAGVEGVCEVVTRGLALPEFDWQIPLMSLPAVFGTTYETVPANAPYIQAWRWEVEEAWRRWPKTDKLRIGIAWAGNPKYKADKVRSFSLSQFGALAAIEGVEWYSLHKEPHSRQIEKYADLISVIDACSADRDFAQTAALIETMDLVITSDTSICHLAGAMGKDVWVMLAHLPDWRWPLTGDGYVWYPQMKLFRQDAPGDWPSAFAKAHALLRQRVALPIISV